MPPQAAASIPVHCSATITSSGPLALATMLFEHGDVFCQRIFPLLEGRL
jgi:hypothetical protein